MEKISVTNRNIEFDTGKYKNKLGFTVDKMTVKQKEDCEKHIYEKEGNKIKILYYYITYDKFHNNHLLNYGVIQYGPAQRVEKYIEENWDTWDCTLEAIGDILFILQGKVIPEDSEYHERRDNLKEEICDLANELRDISMQYYHIGDLVEDNKKE
jgi:hypothetical protein